MPKELGRWSNKNVPMVSFAKTQPCSARTLKPQLSCIVISNSTPLFYGFQHCRCPWPLKTAASSIRDKNSASHERVGRLASPGYQPADESMSGSAATRRVIAAVHLPGFYQDSKSLRTTNLTDQAYTLFLARPWLSTATVAKGDIDPEPSSAKPAKLLRSLGEGEGAVNLKEPHPLSRPVTSLDIQALNQDFKVAPNSLRCSGSFNV